MTFRWISFVPPPIMPMMAWRGTWSRTLPPTAAVFRYSVRWSNFSLDARQAPGADHDPSAASASAMIPPVEGSF
jgi:hypothetical protein